MQSQHKPQFSAWLIEQVGTGQYAGLCYVDQNRFRIPWKHNSRKDCNDEDCKIFREWAVVSGKIHEFPNDKAKWKTNFRCALNNLKKCFKKIQDNTKITEDPHIVYEIINTSHNYGCEPMEDCLNDVDIYSSPIDYLPPGNEVLHEQHTLVNTMRSLELNNHHTGQQQWEEIYEQSQVVPVSYAVVQPSQPVESLPVSQNHTQAAPQQASYYSANPEPVPQKSIYDLEISIHYRRIEVLKTQVSCSRLQLHHHQETPEPNICFPTTECLLDHKQIHYTNQILNSIQRGLLLEVRDTGIYACRQSDKCRVFASTSDPSEALSEHSQLPQNTMMELLSFEKFVSELKQFKENQGGSPHYAINICFGEKFPDGKPMEKKLVVVKVVPLICRQLHEMAQSEGASSLQSACISLQISHNSLFDLISNAFGLPASDEPPQAATPF